MNTADRSREHPPCANRGASALARPSPRRGSCSRSQGAAETLTVSKTWRSPLAGAARGPEVKNGLAKMGTILAFEGGVHAFRSKCSRLRSRCSRAPECALRERDDDRSWRIMLRVDDDAIVILDVFAKKTGKTPREVMERCRMRLKRYDADARPRGK